MGPTASGKSALALDLAERINGDIVNADSMQVYRDFRILTARPSDKDLARAPHHLYGHVDAGRLYSVGRWLEDALAALAAIKARARAPIVVGGTGLYFKALTEGLVALPPVETQLRQALRARLAREGAAALHAELARVDATSAARVSANDAPRILRALEVYEAVGEPLSALQAVTAPPLARSQWVGVALTPPREALYAEIDARFEAMLQAGALEEVRAFAARALDSALPAQKAHGAPALMAHLRGELSLQAAVEIGKRDTRRYAKRQFTWMRGQMKDWPRLAEVGGPERLARVMELWRRSKPPA
jgi:tRNA dimethylallyltransferase